MRAYIALIKRQDTASGSKLSKKGDFNFWLSLSLSLSLSDSLSPNFEVKSPNVFITFRLYRR